ncbi:MAG: TetR/AcrR family transcriptional regulator [Candidatus Krumholzibacteriota bacterium]|nr:TetR/AcrR family transcriptional regulator [Candidatus Krumholzibacteriota bacterium]
MGRPKEYQRDEVLEAATQVFWERGYQATSIGDLVEGTGLHRRSMYEEFGDKEGLFAACLDHFVHVTTKDLAALLAREPLGFENIEAFFRNRVAYVTGRQFKGCLLVKSAIEQGLLTVEARRKLQLYLAGSENSFLECLEAAQQNGEIPQDSDCRTLAKYLMCFLEGVMVMGQTNPSKKELGLVVDTVLSTVKG